MSGTELLNTLLNHANANGSKSTVLKPLGWALGMTLSSLIISAYLKLPEWITIMLAIALGLMLAMYIGAYIYFMLTDSDALRSEKYSIQKMEIQKTLIGDSDRGMKEVSLDRKPPTAVLELQGNDNE